MRDEGRRIVCRKCKESIVVDEGVCHHCGTNIKRNGPYLAASFFGLVLVVVAFLDPSNLLFFGVFGLVVAVLAGYLLYEKRQRIQQANERS